MGNCVRPINDVAVGDKVTIISTTSFLSGINLDSGLEKSTMAITIKEDGCTIWKKVYEVNNKII